MRVATVCPYSLSAPGGVQGQAIGIVSELQKMGVSADLYAPGGDSGSDREDREEYSLSGGSLHIFGPALAVPANGSRAPVCLSPRAWVSVARDIACGGYDIVHLHEPFAPSPAWLYLARTACRRSETPAAYGTVATFHRSGSGGLYGSLRPLWQLLSRAIDMACPVSSEAARTLAGIMGTPWTNWPANGTPGPVAEESNLGGRYRQTARQTTHRRRTPKAGKAGGPRRSEILFNGIDDRFFATTDPIWRSAGQVPVAFAGRHERRKGLELLLRAFRTLHRKCQTGPEPVLWVMGEGPESARLRASYGSDPGVTWFGRVTNEELRSRLRQACVFCAPSMGGESFGVVLLEAMASRAVVVASDIPGYRDVASGIGQLVAPGDPADLAEALYTAYCEVVSGTGLADPARLDRAQDKARGYSMSALTYRYLSLYEQLLVGSV